MTKVRLGLAIGVACGLPVVSLLGETGLWAAPGMDPERQTVPTRTPTSPPGPAPDTPTPSPKREPPEPPPTAATPTSTLESIPTEAPFAVPSPTQVPAVLSPTPMSPSPTAVAGWDFGDAPDPGFPSLLMSQGARHFVVGTDWLGEAVDQELDSGQVDADLYDDGVEVGPLTACQEAELLVKVSVADRENSPHPYDGEHLLYLNVLVDWNGDGSWGGTTPCPEGLVAFEWAVQNLPIDPSSWPEGLTSMVVPVPFAVGPRAGEIWARFTLSYGQVISGDDWDGRGSFNFGETEDYRVTVELGATHALAGETPTPPSPVVATATGAAERLGVRSGVLWGSVLALGAGLAMGLIVAGYWVSRREGG